MPTKENMSRAGFSYSVVPEYGKDQCSGCGDLFHSDEMEYVEGAAEYMCGKCAEDERTGELYVENLDIEEDEDGN